MIDVVLFEVEEARVTVEKDVQEKTHFANIDESAHEVLVAERIHRVLSLFPRLIFHNSMPKLALVLIAQGLPGHLPAALNSQRNQSYPSTTVLQITRESQITSHNQPTLLIPFGSNNTSAYRTSPARIAC